jgi:hypothetical protein
VKRSNNHAFSFERKRNVNDLKTQEKKELIEEEEEKVKSS